MTHYFLSSYIDIYPRHSKIREAINRTYMHNSRFYNRPYILSLIRENQTLAWIDLCEKLDMPTDQRLTHFSMIFESLKELLQAGLITANRPFAESRFDFNGDGLIFSVTPLLATIQHALQISLAELAASDADKRMIISPLFNRLFSTKYKSQILVLMPFTPDLRPVYDDHLKAVAARLQMTIARADDFFTAGHIIDEIWTATVLSEIIIADCTERNANVFYEIGIAHAIGKPVILIARNKDDVPFDLRHRRYIHYEFTPRGMKDFEENVKETIETIRSELQMAQL